MTSAEAEGTQLHLSHQHNRHSCPLRTRRRPAGLPFHTVRHPACDHTGVPGFLGFTHFYSSTTSGGDLLDENSDPSERLAPPIIQLLDSRIDQLKGRVSSIPFLDAAGDHATGTPAVGSAFTLIQNDGKDAVTGTFAGLPQGATLLLDGMTFQINYVGGTSNDVGLTRIA